jgi:hypothetical protein
VARQIYSLLLLTAQPTLPESSFLRFFGAGDGTRTRDLLITNQLLYQLSYASANSDNVLISKTQPASDEELRDELRRRRPRNCGL